MATISIKGKELEITGFGKCTQKEFDRALAELPALIKKARNGDQLAGMSAIELLWALANEAKNTSTVKDFACIYPFGKSE